MSFSLKSGWGGLIESFSHLALAPVVLRNPPTAPKGGSNIQRSPQYSKAFPFGTPGGGGEGRGEVKNVVLPTPLPSHAPSPAIKKAQSAKTSGLYPRCSECANLANVWNKNTRWHQYLYIATSEKIFQILCGAIVEAARRTVWPMNANVCQ